MAKQPDYTYRQSKISLQKVFSAIVVLAAALIILFPLLVRAKTTLGDVSCARNLGQIGQAISLYSADHDERFPAAVDASDKFVPGLWSGQPARKRLIEKLPLLNVALMPYVKNKNVFRCPVDNGGLVMENSFLSNPTPFPCSPSVFQQYGSSYFFRTEIMFRSLSQRGYWPPATVAILFDAFGHWHAGGEPLAMGMIPVRSNGLMQTYRYNALFGDSHVRSLSYSELQETWSHPL
jgi:hypothetical protein